MSTIAEVLLVTGGLGVLLLTTVDLLWTVLWPDGGAGPLTERLTTLLWRVLPTASATGEGRGAHRLRSAAGPSIVVAVASSWVLLLYAGWALVFAAAADGALVQSSTRAPADLGSRLYFAGYTLFTLGNGELQPSGGWWRLATVLTSANGLLLITLAVTYLMPIVSAATTRRALAGEITSLGSSPGEFVATAWDPRGFDAVGPQMASIASTLGTLSDQHLAYPVLHYFHSRPATSSIVVAVAVLDEALTLMRFGVAEEARPASAVITPARQAVGIYLNTLASGQLPTDDRPPPPPDLQPLRRAGIPVVDDAVFAEAVTALAERRIRLQALVAVEGWSWQQVAPPPDDGSAPGGGPGGS